MKFYRSYFYPKLEWKVLNASLMGILLLVIALGSLMLSLNPKSPISNESGVLVRIVFLGGSVLVLTCASVFHPFGWTSIYVDKLMIRVVPYRHFLRLLLPFHRTFYLNRRTHIYFDLSDIEMSIGQQDISADVITYGLTRASRRKLAGLLTNLARYNKNIELEIAQQLIYKKRLRFAPGEEAAYPFYVKKGDRVEMTLEVVNVELFDIHLKDMTAEDLKANDLMAVRDEEAGGNNIELRWKIINSGTHRLVIRNTSNDRKNRIEFHVRRYHRTNHQRHPRKAPGSKSQGPEPDNIQTNK
jgi:hypothetical protein